MAKKKKKDAAKEPEVSVAPSSISSIQTVNSEMVPRPAPGFFGRKIGLILGISIGLGGAGYFSYSTGLLDKLAPAAESTADNAEEGSEKSAADMPPTAPVTDKDLDSLTPEATKAADTGDTGEKTPTDVIEQKAPLEANKADATAPVLVPAPDAVKAVEAPKAVEKAPVKAATKKADSKKASAAKKKAVNNLKKGKVTKTKAKPKAKAKKTASKT